MSIRISLGTKFQLKDTRKAFDDFKNKQKTYEVMFLQVIV